MQETEREGVSINHSYEEMRRIALQVLADRLASGHPPAQYTELKEAVGNALEQSGGGSQNPATSMLMPMGYGTALSPVDADLLFEVFSTLIREGILIMGLNELNAQFPWFRVSQFGKRVIENRDPYFFEDVAGYEAQVKTQIPSIDPATLIYLKEAVQSFKVGCVLASSVMLGVSAEHTFNKLLETIQNNSTHYETYKNVFNETTLLRKLNKFRNILDQNKGTLPPAVKEDLDINFSGIMSVIRNFRNDAGHPTGRIISRDQSYILLQLFIPYCKQVYQLIDEFKKP
jgi:hypothetical protein